ncbi:mechanosensitive ion channel family protein [Phenylobacterium montanum]|uniref:Small-conductance mechanosensitive channel n=2 Tax=Phenylobacterium montanum TaxID=2823693 RepID=A0A975IX88_9CAUL|nr:mechanosensitive ion channel family protein [Caulobacter sp. S6]
MDGHPRLLQRMMDGLGQMAVNLVVAALIAVVTIWVSGWVAGLVRRAIGRLSRTNGNESILQSFVPSLARWAILIFGLIAVLEQLGVKTTSILAILGAASLAVGLALQGSLSNVAASVMILILRPYRIGDFVEINGKMGTVRGLDLFGTRLADPDNLEIFMPNSKVFGEMIINYSSPSNRRMELNFRLDYDDDADHALAVLKDCIAADKRILAKPEPWTGITALGDSAVTVTLRAWAPVGTYWDVRFAMLKRVKDRFKAEGFRVPYPRQISTETEPRAAARKHAPRRAEPDAPPKASRRKSSANQPTSQEGG